MAALLAAPASWAAQTLGHATNGTFPEGGPATPGLLRRPGGGAWRRRASRPAAAPAAVAAAAARSAALRRLTSVLSYVNSHGGGTIAVSSQSGASVGDHRGGAKVAGIGGFSGRESDISPRGSRRPSRTGASAGS